MLLLVCGGALTDLKKLYRHPASSILVVLPLSWLSAVSGPQAASIHKLRSLVDLKSSETDYMSLGHSGRSASGLNP